jgi:hypothetical protein
MCILMKGCTMMYIRWIEMAEKLLKYCKTTGKIILNSFGLKKKSIPSIGPR